MSSPNTINTNTTTTNHDESFWGAYDESGLPILTPQTYGASATTTNDSLPVYFGYADMPQDSIQGEAAQAPPAATVVTDDTRSREDLLAEIASLRAQLEAATRKRRATSVGEASSPPKRARTTAVPSPGGHTPVCPVQQQGQQQHQDTEPPPRSNVPSASSPAATSCSPRKKAVPRSRSIAPRPLAELYAAPFMALSVGEKKRVLEPLLCGRDGLVGDGIAVGGSLAAPALDNGLQIAPVDGAKRQREALEKRARLAEMGLRR